MVFNTYLTVLSKCAVGLLQMFLSLGSFVLDYKAFQEAAEHFQPYIKFFATFDKGVST